MELNVKVNSTAIRDMKWSRTYHWEEQPGDDEGELTVEFTSGAVYLYTEVLLSDVLKVISAPSVGKEFAFRIRNSYPYERLPEMAG